MSDHIVLRKRRAAIKSESARKAVYYFQSGGGARYEREVPVDTVVRVLLNDPRSRLRIRLEDSQHTVTVVDNKRLKTGYELTF